VAEGLASLRTVPGRLERVGGADGPLDVFVDYAHTDDALRNVLSSLRPVTRGRLVLVFGCGGDRDRTKRPRMARVAEELADEVVITSDNPRSERPEAIIEEICAGLSAGGRSRATVEPDRRKAIGLAVELAGGGDVVLIAGKGHETYQVLGDQRVHFDDVEEAAKAVGARETAR
jgi:UDP-N-acetylmuramoyl-L-alanyl-D-glutamate--2,6-diaminopimelate ligase